MNEEALQIAYQRKPEFLEFLQYYIDEFKANKGFGIWLKEYEDMEKKGLFRPNLIWGFFVSALKGNDKLGFIRDDAVWHIGWQAIDATKNATPSLYKVCVITGETAQDDDGDELIDLEYSEAMQICASFNKEFGEEFYKVTKQ